MLTAVSVVLQEESRQTDGANRTVDSAFYVSLECCIRVACNNLKK